MPAPTRHAELLVDSHITLIDIAGYGELLDPETGEHFTPHVLSVSTAKDSTGDIGVEVRATETVDGGRTRVWTNHPDVPDYLHIEAMPGELRRLAMAFRPGVTASLLEPTISL